MDTLAAYMTMGGYGGFIWSAYGVTALVMAGLVVSTWRSLKAREKELKILQEMSTGRRGRSRGAADEGAGQ